MHTVVEKFNIHKITLSSFTSFILLKMVYHLCQTADSNTLNKSTFKLNGQIWVCQLILLTHLKTDGIGTGKLKKLSIISKSNCKEPETEVKCIISKFVRYFSTFTDHKVGLLFTMTPHLTVHFTTVINYLINHLI